MQHHQNAKEQGNKGAPKEMPPATLVPATSGKANKNQRLAQALRANLKRRKAAGPQTS